MPARLPADVAKVFKQTLHFTQMEKGYSWVLDNMSEEKEPLELLASFIKRYERQVFQLKGEVLEGYAPAFRAAVLAKMFATLPRFRMKFADKAYNFRFLRIWMKKRLLAEILGITILSVERKIYLSGRKPPVFLNEELSRLLPETFLKIL